jgi:hypothetical protein
MSNRMRKTKAEISKECRARKKEQGLKRVVLYLPEDVHKYLLTAGSSFKEGMAGEIVRMTRARLRRLKRKVTNVSDN